MKPTFVLSVDYRHKVAVFIWPTLKALRAAWRARGTGEDGRHTYAFFHSPRLTISVMTTNCRGVKNKTVGEIHLAAKHFGAGVFAHELQHFTQSWIDAKGLEPHGKDWERVAYLNGNMTTEFWKKYYKRYPD